MASPPERPSLGPFEAVSVLSQGGGGTVWSVRDETGHERFVAKVANNERGPLAEALRREWRHLLDIPSGALPEPVAWIPPGPGRPPAIVMQRRPGRDLKEVFRDGDASAVIGAVGGALDALQALHAEGLVHGDLHPGNILVDPQHGVSLLDLGLAQTAGSAPAVGAGLPAFAAPERLRGEGVDPRDDLFSLATCAWIGLAGSAPYRDYPAMIPARQALLEPPASSPHRQLLTVIASWLSPVRDLRPAHVEMALRAWREATGRTNGVAASLRRAGARTWRWGRWAEPEIPWRAEGDVTWLSGPVGSGKTGALWAIADAAPGPTAWLRPALLPGTDAVALTERMANLVADGDAPSSDAAALDVQAEIGLAAIGEQGGAAQARVRLRLEALRSRLGRKGVLLVDDEHRLPEPTREALAGLSQGPGATVVIATAAVPAGLTGVTLPVPTADEVASAVSSASGAVVDRALAASVARAVGASRGTILPLFAAMLEKGIARAEHGRIEATGDTSTLDDDVASALPGDAAAALETLRLEGDLADLLAHLAVAGRCYPGVGGDPAPSADHRDAEAAGVLRRLAGGGWLATPDVQRALQHRLPKRALGEAAFARAKWLAALDPLAALHLQVLAASHDASAAPPGAEVAAAVSALIAQGEPTTAILLADQWLALPRARRERASVVAAAIRAETAIGRYASALERADALSAAARRGREIRLALAERAFRAGEYPAVIQEADAVLAEAKDNAACARAAVLKAFACTWQGDLDGAAATMKAVPESREDAAADCQLNYLEALAAYYRGEVAEAANGFSRLDDARFPSVRAAAAAGLGLCAHRDGKLDEARAAYDRSRQLAEQAGDRGRVLNMSMNIAVLDHEAGDLGRALSGYARVIRDAQRLGNDGALARSRNNRGNLLTAIGDFAGARADLEAALGQLKGSQNAYLQGNVRCLLAELARRSCRVDEALAHVDAAIALMRADDASAERLEWQMERSECLLAAGEVVEARQQAASVLRDASTLGNEELQARSGWMLARCDLEQGTTDEPLADLHERLQSCAAAVPTKKTLLRVQIDADVAAVRAMRGDASGASLLAAESLSRLHGVAATLSARHARTFRHGQAHAPLFALLRLLSRLQADDPLPTGGRTLGGAAMNAVLALNRRMSAEHDLDRLLEVLMDAAVALTGAERGFLVLDERAAPKTHSDMRVAGEPDLRVAIARNLDQEHLRKAAHKLSWSVALGVFEHGERVVTTDASADPRFAEQASVHSGNLRSILCVPLGLQGRAIGVLYVDNRFTSGAFTQDHASVLEALAAQAAIAIHTARLIAGYQRNKRALEDSKTQVEQLNEQLQHQLTDTVEQLSSAREALDAQRLEIERRSDYRQIKGESPQLRRLFALMDRVRKHDFPVIVVGESGTGKELVARAIHFTGARRGGPFVAINCGAVPENLLESELFGHKRGAFTGAVAERDGLFVSADQGTLFLDEIGEMPMAMQVKLLRVLQTGEVQAVGGAHVRKVDVRVLAATHRDLDAMVAEGQFREDLLYRLRVVQLHVPALRERTDDLPILVEHFLGLNREAGLGDVKRVSSRALAVMRGYPWPGNIRELEQFLKSACLFAEGEELDVADMQPLATRRHPGRATVSAPAEVQGLPEVLLGGTMAEIERFVIDARLQRLDGNKSRTAQSLGIDRGTLYNKLKDPR